MDYTRNIAGSLEPATRGTCSLNALSITKRNLQITVQRLFLLACNVEIENNAGCFLQHDKKALGRVSYGQRGNVSFDKTR